MNLTRQVCENALVRLQTASKAQLQVVQHYFARRDLEANLAALLDAARGHEAHSVLHNSCLARFRLVFHVVGKVSCFAV